MSDLISKINDRLLELDDIMADSYESRYEPACGLAGCGADACDSSCLNACTNSCWGECMDDCKGGCGGRNTWL